MAASRTRRDGTSSTLTTCGVWGLRPFPPPPPRPPHTPMGSSIELAHAPTALPNNILGTLPPPLPVFFSTALLRLSTLAINSWSTVPCQVQRRERWLKGPPRLPQAWGGGEEKHAMLLTAKTNRGGGTSTNAKGDHHRASRVHTTARGGQQGEKKQHQIKLAPCDEKLGICYSPAISASSSQCFLHNKSIPNTNIMLVTFVNFSNTSHPHLHETTRTW